MCHNFQQLVCAISKALGDPSISVASGAFTLDPKAVCMARHGLLLWRRFAGHRQRRRLRRMRFAAFLDSNSRRRRWRCRRCNLEQVWRHGLGCRKLRGFPRQIRFWRRRTVVLRWRLHGLCWLVQVRFAARARKAYAVQLS
jgi:hypothetical protein